MSASIEVLLGRALRGEVVVHEPQHVRKPVRKNHTPPHYHRYKTTIAYSVQESYGGPRFRYEFSLNTFIESEAKAGAEREMAKLGYKNAVLLEVVKS